MDKLDLTTKQQYKNYIEKKILTPKNCRNDLNFLTSDLIKICNLTSEEYIKIILLNKYQKLDEYFQKLPPIDPLTRSEFEKRMNGEKVSLEYINQVAEYLLNGGDLKDHYVMDIFNEMKRLK